VGKRPAYQWYPGDLRRDLAVQACSFEARALWREMLDLMHDGEPYGHLTAGGVILDDAQLARIIGIKPAKVTAWLFELESRKVFSRTPEGVIYSRRMVRDEATREKRAAGGKLGGNPALMDTHKDNGKDNLPANLRPTPAVAVASAVASALQEQPAAEKAPQPPSAAKTLAKIKDLAETRDVPGQGTKHFIRKAAVQALGPKTFAAYCAIGGAEAVLNTPGEKWFILVKQFENELRSA